jgi:hypothetical protein
VAHHRLGVVGGDDDEVEPADPVGDRLQLDEPGLLHRAGVERRHLVLVEVGGAQEPGGVLELGDVHGAGVHPVALEPRAVVGVEVLPDRADQDRVEAELPEPEADVGRHAAAADLELVDEERQAHPVELVGDELLGEAAGEGHQVVGRDGAGHGDAHGRSSIGGGGGGGSRGGWWARRADRARPGTVPTPAGCYRGPRAARVPYGPPGRPAGVRVSVVTAGPYGGRPRV